MRSAAATRSPRVLPDVLLLLEVTRAEDPLLDVAAALGDPLRALVVDRDPKLDRTRVELLERPARSAGAGLGRHSPPARRRRPRHSPARPSSLAVDLGHEGAVRGTRRASSTDREAEAACPRPPPPGSARSRTRRKRPAAGGTGTRVYRRTSGSRTRTVRASKVLRPQRLQVRSSAPRSKLVDRGSSLRRGGRTSRHVHWAGPCPGGSGGSASRGGSGSSRACRSAPRRRAPAAPGSSRAPCPATSGSARRDALVADESRRAHLRQLRLDLLAHRRRHRRAVADEVELALVAVQPEQQRRDPTLRLSLSGSRRSRSRPSCAS